MVQLLGARSETGELLSPVMNGCNESDVFQGDPPLLEVPPVIFPPVGYMTAKDSADFVFDATELFKHDFSHRDTLIMTDIEFLPDSSFRVKRWWYLNPPHLNASANFGGAEIPFPNATHMEGVTDPSAQCTNPYNLRTCDPYVESMANYQAKNVINGIESYMDPTVNGPHGFANFDIVTHPPDADHLIQDQEYAINGPKVIYVKGGPVRVHGIYKGRYTVVTDEYETYHRHAWNTMGFPSAPIDTVWCNIWITDDLRNADAAIGNQSPPQPDEQCVGGSENRMGLISGANVIVANTPANGANNSSNGSDVIIHAVIMALNESFTVQYWQNTTTQYWDNPPPKGDGLSVGYFGPANDTNDERGTIYISGGIIQKYRGYVVRNNPGPYIVSIGYDKNYSYDENNACSPPPHFPEANFVDIAGCIEAQYSNYDPNAVIDDGSCIIYFGDLMIDGQINVVDVVYLVDIVLNDIDYIPEGDFNDDGINSIVDIIILVDIILNPSTIGCTDTGAVNYNPDAYYDDGSCEYGDGTCTDIDGNSYETVQIGTQLWMAENLKVTHYNNGDEIPTGYSDSEWEDTETGAYAVYPYWDDDTSLETCEGDCAEVYGNLYNWYAVDDTRDICPEGWHVPTDAEWTVLTDYLGGSSVAGGKMKSTGTIENEDGLWHSPNLGATNESGFTALPGGYRVGNDGNYLNMGSGGCFWSSTASSSIYAWSRNLSYFNSNVYRGYYGKRNGFSIRCAGD